MKTLFTIAAIACLVLCANSAFAQRWEKASLPAPYDKGYYLDIFFLPTDQNLGWACDQNAGYVVRTVDGGRTWQGTKVDPAKGACHLEYIQFLDANVGYCSGPCGMYKSVDGGATWVNIKPAGSPIMWGGWFRNANEGWFTGGGCGYNAFLRTADGGTTFTMFVDSTVQRSAMADPYWDATMPQNTLYAVGSGTIWKSESDGVNWQVHAYTGANAPWHEELAMFANSMLVPSGGGKCDSLPGVTTGMRFSPDFGTTWREFNTGENMFGTFLHDATTGWAAGYNASVYYTSNAGQSWQLRNCGLEGAHMDDIFFLNNSDGWVVGDGIFRVAPALRTQSKTAMNFTAVCPDSARRDTVLIRNINWFTSPWTATITGADAAMFRVANAPLAATLASCTPLPIIVEYKPTTAGVHTAILTVRVQQPDTTLVIALTGDRREKSAFPVDTVATYTARVGENVSRILLWRATPTSTLENVVSVQRISGDTNITLLVPTPSTVLPSGTQMAYTAVVWDTGWTQARFRVRLGPCSRDTTVTIRIYGTSPIFNSITNVMKDAQCRGTDTLRIPISNTGNAPLTIRSIVAQNLGEQAFRPLSFTSNRFGPPWVLDPRTFDTLLVEYVPQTGIDNVSMIIEHDDISRARGQKTPWQIALQGRALAPNVTITPMVIDLGSMCTGALFEKSFTIQNNASATASILLSTTSPNISGLTAGGITLLGGQQRQFRFTYRARTKGVILDTIMVYLQPCDVAQRVIVRGLVEDLAITITPTSVSDSADVNTLFRKRFVIRLAAGDSATVYDIRVSPLPGAMRTSIPTLPRKIVRGDSIEVWVEWSASIPTTYIGRLEVEAFTTCSTTVDADIRLRTMTSDLDVGPNALTWLQDCSIAPLRDSVYIDVRPGRAVTLLSATIREPGVPFRVISTNLPRVIPPGTRQWVVVQYEPTGRGLSTATLDVATDVPDGNFSISLRGTVRDVVLAATPRLLNAGNVSSCQPSFTKQLVVRNTGDVITDVQVQLTPPTRGISLATPTVRVLASDSAIVILTFDPAQMAVGTSRSTVLLRDATCGRTDSIDVEVTLVAGDKLVLTPDPVDGGVLQPGQRAIATVTIANPGVDARTIVSLTIEPPSAEWRVVQPPTGQVVAGGSSLDATLEYSPAAAGTHVATLVLRDADQCTTTSSVTLRGTAVDPKISPTHYLHLRMDDYSVAPGTKLSIPVYWDSDIHEAQVDSFFTTVVYNSLNFAVDSVSAGLMTDGTIALRSVPDTVQVALTSAGALCGSRGVLAVLHGTAYSALPDSTILEFMRPIIWATEAVNVTVEHGSVIVDACGPRFLIRLGQDLSLTPRGSIPMSGQVTVDVHSRYNDVVAIDVVNSLGAVVITLPNVAVNAGTTNLSIPSNELPSGVYTLRCSSAFAPVTHLTVPVVR